LPDYGIDLKEIEVEEVRQKEVVQDVVEEKKVPQVIFAMFVYAFIFNGRSD
jgi:hypothetical protein